MVRDAVRAGGMIRLNQKLLEVLCGGADIFRLQDFASELALGAILGPAPGPVGG